jgi:Protein of unknown function (DUF669)
MARFDTSFDASGVEPAAGYDVLPAGKYVAQIIESEMRVTSNGMGQFLWLMLDILEGPYTGRKVFDQLNLVNQNPTTVEIAQRALSAICHATGKLQVADSEELHLIPMTIQVTVKPPKNGYGERNAIRYLVPAEGASPAPAKPAHASAAAQAAAAPKIAAAPWNKKA